MNRFRLCPVFIVFVILLSLIVPQRIHAETVSFSVSVPDTRVTFIGASSPNAFITFLEDSIVSGTAQADSSGLFQKTLTNENAGLHQFSLYALDSMNRLTPTYSFSISLLNQMETTISGILLPTTIEPLKPVFTTAEPIVILGEAAPASTVNLFVQSDPLTFNFPVGGSGDWQYSVTNSLNVGDHTAYAKLNDSLGHQSIFSSVVNFSVIQAPTATPSPTLIPIITPVVPSCNSKSKSDINVDSRVDLTDFSIMMYDWQGSAVRSDLNCDGTVNLTDFSILMFNWTG
ncbi:hypothetical protein HGA91_05125 [candidate division WWE3 bacterium]|nr:hypothetical protein [candidate division WWE3 bacterium]